jgi:CheY-like chemotaxis protein/sRNA-binding carbon storage regulator CsrA
MLVLARRPGQKIVFPSLGVAIEVLRSGGSVTKLGIEAPDHVPVLRDEVLVKPASAADRVPGAAHSPSDRERRHELRHALHSLLLKLQQLQQQLETGKPDDPEQHLADVIDGLSHLEQSTNDAVAPATPLKVLIVEDQANERELLATCLRLAGVHVATAGNGREAFDFLHDHELPDLVLLDMVMPDMDGPTFVKTVRDDIRLHNLRIFAVSGYSSSEFDSNHLQLDGWFSKPVRIDSLLQAVRPGQVRPVVGTA